MPETTALTPDLLLRHEAFVLRLARSLVRDEASAQDVTQETLLAALRHAPPVGSLRGWLARVVRHRASDQRRGEHRRAAREAGSARPEAEPPAPSAAERLELEHGVVRAVLALDEPYRTTVVAVYYEGLTPAELARREGVPAGTVRARLSRALDHLRSKLDREHGDRATWGLALAGLLRGRPSGLATASSASGAASGSALPAWTWVAAGATVVGATLLLGPGWFAQGSPAREPVRASVEPRALAEVREPPTRVREAVTPDRDTVEVSADASSSAPSEASPAVQELTRLVDDARLLKSLILQRRLAVDPSVRAQYAWLEALPGAGLVRLIDRSVTGHGLDLPWMQGGGSYYSFTEQDHDYQRRPQIGLENGGLCTAFYGNYVGAVLDLGPDVFRSLAHGPRGVPSGLDERRLAAWELLQEPVQDPSAIGDWGLRTRLRELGLDGRARVERGHGYLVRAVSPDEFDVLVAFEVAQADADSCTLAWRVLEERPVPDARPVRPIAPGADRLPPDPPELAVLSLPELHEALDRLRIRAEALLFDDLPASPLEGRDDAGLARIVDGSSPFCELPRVREGGIYWSFATRGHGYGDEPDLALRGGRFEIGFAGVDTGVVVDLGTKPLAEARVLPSGRGPDPALDFALWQEVDQTRPRDEVIAEMGGLQQRVGELDANDADAIVGHSYLVRSIRENEHDLLAVFEVLEIDERGALIAWQVARTWPVPSGR